MHLSLFAPPGLEDLEGGKPIAEAIHKTALALFARHSKDVGAFSTEPGSLVDLFCFATAIVFARVAKTRERIDGERFASDCYAFLAAFEEEYGLHPAADDTIVDRQLALALAKELPRGSRRTELEQALRNLLGDDYLGLHVASGAEVVAWPEELSDEPQLLLDASVPRKLVRILDAISADLGGPITVRYTPIDPSLVDDETHTLAVGDRLVVEPEILHRAEVVTITELGTSGNDPTFTAVFEEAHEPDAWATQMPFPAWTSTQRHLLVALPAEAASDPVTRQRVNERLRKTVTTVTTWNVCSSSGSGTLGPWTIGDPQLGMLGQNPLGLISVP